MRIASLLALLSVLVSPLSFADVTNITNEELATMDPSKITIIDVRRPDEWQASGLIEGSHPVMFFDKKGRYDVKTWLAEIDKLVERDEPIALICARGVRSSSIADLLDAKLGFTHVHNVTGGMVDWVKEKRPVVAWSP